MTAYKLGTVESANLIELLIATGAAIYVGIRAYVRHADGSMDEIAGIRGQASAVAVLSAGAAATVTVSAGFEVREDVSLQPTDAIVIEVYGDITSPPSALLATYITEQLGGTKLNAGAWTVYYRLRRTRAVGGLSTFYFRFGITGDDSYIENFSWTLPPLLIETITANNFPMDYLPSPVKAQQLTSKVSGATIQLISQDYPLTMLKKDKAKELKSKWTPP